MPHLKVSPFDTSDIENHLAQSDLMTFRAKSLTSSDELIGVELGGEEFLIQIKPDSDATLVKYDKVTRPLKVNLLKEALDRVAKELNLQVKSSNITIHNTKAALSSEYFKKIEDFENITYPKEKISVEVGFGSGKHLLYQAQKNPDTLFIGLEIHTPSAQQVLKQIELQGLDNIWVVNYDARLFLEMLPSNACEQIFVHFPVPWDKKPHRRVISPSFLDESMRVLRKDGRLECLCPNILTVCMFKVPKYSLKYIILVTCSFYHPHSFLFTESMNNAILVQNKTWHTCFENSVRAFA